MQIPTPFVADARFTPDEIAAIRAFEAIRIGLAVPRRNDPDYARLLQSAGAKGFLPWSGRLRPSVNLFD